MSFYAGLCAVRYRYKWCALVDVSGWAVFMKFYYLFIYFLCFALCITVAMLACM